MPNALAFVQLAWPIYKKYFWQFVGLILINIALLVGLALATLILLATITNTTIAVIIAVIVLLAYAGFIMASFQALVINAGEGGRVQINRALQTGLKFMFAAAAVTVVTGLIEVIGTLLLVIPGLILLTLFAYVLIEVVKNHRLVPDALKGSVNTALKAPWLVAQLVFLGLAVAAVLGLVPFGGVIILLVIYPVWFIATYLQYKLVKKLAVKKKATAGVIWSTILFILIWLGLTGYQAATPTGYVNLGPTDFENRLEQRLEQFFNQQIKEI